MWKKLLLLLLLFSSLFGRVWAVDYTQDANAVAAYTMDVDESPIDDVSPNSNTGTLKGAGEPDFSSSGKFGGCFVWDSTDDTVQVGSGASITGTGDMAFVAYFKRAAFSSPSTISLWSQRNDNYENIYSIWLTAAGEIELWAWPQGALISSTTGYDDDTWHHAAVYRSSGNAYIYIDGTQRGGPWAWPQSLVSQTCGMGYERRDNNGWFGGSLDDLAIFNRALSSTEINDIKDNGLKPSVVTSMFITFDTLVTINAPFVFN